MACAMRGLLLGLLIVSMVSAQTAGQTCLVPDPPPNVDAGRDSLIGGQVVKPSLPLNVTVWKGDATQPGFVFPELSDGEFGIPNLQNKPNFGIGVSGGGLRATSLALGWLRGMHMLGLFQRARYLGSASGGSFANAMVSFTDSTLVGRRLGTYIAPQNATPGRLRDLNRGTFAYTISHMEPTFYQTFIEAWFTAGFSANRQQPDSESAFARTISMVALNPLHLGLLNSTVTAAGTIGNVHRRIADVGRRLNLSVYRLTSVSPFPLITGNILDSTEAMFFYPFEMTPLYAGSPCNFSRYTTGVPKGGGLVENLGFNARLDRAPAALQVGRPQTVSVTSRFVQPLVGQVSVSGGIMAIELQHQIQGAPGQGTGNSIASGQPVYDMFNFQDYSTERFPFGDGGYTDNQGLIAMLRRKVRKILLFYAVANPTTDKDVWSMANSGLSLPFGRCTNCYTYLNTNITDQLINNASRVFEEQHEFDRLFDEYQGNRCNGTVNYFRANLTVMENAFLGVPGGWQAEVFIIMNAEVKKWEDLLADPTKALLNRSRTDPETLAKAAEHPLQTHELVNFPFFPINIFRYDSLAVSALTNFATWHVMELQQQLREFVNSAETTN